MTRRARFIVDTSPEAVERLRKLIDYSRAVAGWDEALHCAYKGDTEKLRAYLLRPELRATLNEYKYAQLADLIDRRIERRQGTKGRKPGRIPPRDPDTATVHDVVRLARTELRRMRQRNGGKAPWGGYKAAVRLAAERLGDDGNVECDMKEAVQQLWRGRPANQSHRRI
jgi:hypothetical protein